MSVSHFIFYFLLLFLAFYACYVLSHSFMYVSTVWLHIWLYHYLYIFFLDFIFRSNFIPTADFFLSFSTITYHFSFFIFSFISPWKNFRLRRALPDFTLLPEFFSPAAGLKHLLVQLYKYVPDEMPLRLLTCHCTHCHVLVLTVTSLSPLTRPFAYCPVIMPTTTPLYPQIRQNLEKWR